MSIIEKNNKIVMKKYSFLIISLILVFHIIFWPLISYGVNILSSQKVNITHTFGSMSILSSKKLLSEKNNIITQKKYTLYNWDHSITHITFQWLSISEYQLNFKTHYQGFLTLPESIYKHENILTNNHKNEVFKYDDMNYFVWKNKWDIWVISLFIVADCKYNNTAWVFWNTINDSIVILDVWARWPPFLVW